MHVVRAVDSRTTGIVPVSVNRSDRGRAAGAHRRRAAGAVSNRSAVSGTLVGPGRVKVRAVERGVGAKVADPSFYDCIIIVIIHVEMAPCGVMWWSHPPSLPLA